MSHKSAHGAPIHLPYLKVAELVGQWAAVVARRNKTLGGYSLLKLRQGGYNPRAGIGHLV